MLARIVGTVNANAFLRGHRCINALRITGRNRQICLDHAFRQAILERRPGADAIGGLENSAVGSAPLAILPRALARFPQAGVTDARIFRIHLDIIRASVFVFI